MSMGALSCLRDRKIVENVQQCPLAKRERSHGAYFLLALFSLLLPPCPRQIWRQSLAFQGYG